LIRTSLFKKIGLLATLLFISPFANGYKATNEVHTNSLTHPEVQRSLSLLPSKDLLVGLEPYLGREPFNNSKSKALSLISAGKPLVLKDSSGIVHKSRAIRIEWRKVPLKLPKYFERQVIGPFASYESAHTFATNLNSQGISNVIAHPSDWEVWIPQGINLPSSIQVNAFIKKTFDEVQPVLKLPNGELFLSGPIFIHSPDGLRWKGGTYKGPFLLKPDAYGSWTFIEQVSLEDYLLGVVPHEIGPLAPLSSKAAQAVLARTWAVANSSRFAVDGYHLCNDTQCQVYKDPDKADHEVKRAIRETSNKILTWQGKPIHAVYHATNGGIMASANEAWDMKALPYLKAGLDGSKRWKKEFSMPLNGQKTLISFLSIRDGAYGNNHYLFRWTRKLTSKDLKKYLNALELNDGTPRKLKVLERGPSGRVLALEIIDHRNNSLVTLRRDAIRRIIKNLPSTLFVIKKADQGVWEFQGGGFGHGAGMSQAGATDLALRGWTTKKILQHYYPGTTYESLR